MIDLRGLMSFAYLRAHGENIRVHGNGFLQLDLPDDCRLHIFAHPALPSQRQSTHIHDRRFGFGSKVLRGRLVNVCYSLGNYILDSRNAFG